jgi:hypothetical protein
VRLQTAHSHSVGLWHTSTVTVYRACADISREEIEAIAQYLRKRNAQSPLPRPRFIGSLSAADHPHEPAIVVTSIKLMPYGDSSYPHLIPLLEFAIERYFDYNEPLGNYSGKAADSIAGIVEKLASLYTRYQQPERALALIERLLASRAKAINDHLGSWEKRLRQQLATYYWPPLPLGEGWGEGHVWASAGFSPHKRQD